MRFPEIFYLIRHGETDWNKNNIAMGQTDIPLNKEGISQTIQAGICIKARANIRTICYSPLSRTKETANLINKYIQTDMIAVDDLKEFSLGVLEGKPNPNKDWFIDWENGLNDHGVESSEEFKQRVMNGLFCALSYPGPVLLVTHGGVYWQLKSLFNKCPSDIPNGVPFECRINIDNKTWNLMELKN